MRIPRRALPPALLLTALIGGGSSPRHRRRGPTGRVRRHLASRPETVVWGEIPIGRPPALTVASGAVVTIDTLTHAGATQNEEPESYLEALGVAQRDPPDMLDFWASRPSRPREGRSGHILTGPIYVDGAAAGDVLDPGARPPCGCRGA